MLYSNSSVTASQHTHTHFRKSCLHRLFQFSICAISKPPDYKGLPPICVPDKSNHREQLQNVFVDDRGFLDKTAKHYDALLHNVDGGVILRKLKNLPPSLDKVYPLFVFPYD